MKTLLQKIKDKNLRLCLHVENNIFLKGQTPGITQGQISPELLVFRNIDYARYRP